MLIVEHDNNKILLNPLVQIDGDSIKISSTTAYCNGTKINVPSYDGNKTDDIWFNMTKFGKLPEAIGAFKVYDASRTTMTVFKEPGLWEKIKNGLKKYL